jgi:hypothetical protein
MPGFIRVLVQDVDAVMSNGYYGCELFSLPPGRVRAIMLQCRDEWMVTAFSSHVDLFKRERFT